MRPSLTQAQLGVDQMVNRGLGPTFIVIGAAKAGTTTMFELLGAHPEVFVTNPKEPHYFSRLVGFEDGWDWYRSLFSSAASSAARGEASTSYAHPNRIDFAAPRIRKHVPDCRVIYMVRHPVRRLESDWKMRFLEGRLHRSIDKAIEYNATLVTFGLYWKHLNTYRALFPDEQILVVFLEDLARDPRREIERAYRHIGVDPTFTPPMLGQRCNTSTDRARSLAATTMVRHVPGVRHFASLLPERVVELGKRVLTPSKHAEPTIEWSPRALQAVSKLFREDSHRLLRHFSKPHDFWDLGAAP